jgi:phage-related protein
MNKAVKGDFIGFTYGGVHFSGHGLMRVSDGSRYSTYLLPSINNKSVQIPGKDGSYFFNSNFGNMEFSISVAYDSVTETDMRKIK